MNIFSILLPEDTFIQIAIATIHLSFLGAHDVLFLLLMLQEDKERVKIGKLKFRQGPNQGPGEMPERQELKEDPSRL